MSHKLDATLTANRSGMFELSREQLQIIQDSDNDATKEILKLRADNKALLDALKGARTNVAYAYQPENCGDHCRNNCRDCVLKNTLEDLDAALAEHSEPQ